MGRTTVSYERNRPFLTIESTGHSKLGNCYSESRWRFTANTPLTPERIRALLVAAHIDGNAGTTIDGGVDPTGFDVTVPVERDSLTGEVVSLKPINTYTGRVCEESSSPYYVADVAVRIDSGD